MNSRTAGTEKESACVQTLFHCIGDSSGISYAMKRLREECARTRNGNSCFACRVRRERVASDSLFLHDNSLNMVFISQNNDTNFKIWYIVIVV